MQEDALRRSDPHSCELLRILEGPFDALPDLEFDVLVTSDLRPESLWDFYE